MSDADTLPATGKPRILLVDDVSENLHVLMNMLRDDYALSAATSGEKALALAARQPGPDLILLDIRMPGMDGYEVLRRLKGNPATSGIMILMVTALNELGDIERAVQAGTDDFLSKPVNKAELLKRVDNMLKLRHVTDEVERLRQYIEKMESRG